MCVFLALGPSGSFSTFSIRFLCSFCWTIDAQAWSQRDAHLAASELNQHSPIKLKLWVRLMDFRINRPYRVLGKSGAKLGVIGSSSGDSIARIVLCRSRMHCRRRVEVWETIRCGFAFLLLAVREPGKINLFIYVYFTRTLEKFFLLTGSLLRLVDKKLTDCNSGRSPKLFG